MSVSDVIAGNDVKTSEYNNLRALAPQPGMIAFWHSATPPTGWFLCNGQAVSRSTYSDLFTAISTTFGVGDGSTTYNVPDMRDRIPVGVSGTGVYTLGNTGTGTFTLSASTTPTHDHDTNTIANATHSHQLPAPGGGAVTTTVDQKAGVGSVAWSTDSVADHNHTGASGSEGSGTAFTIWAKYYVMNAIIKY